MLTIDIHCHTFNANDLPVDGFVRRVAFGDDRLGGVLAELLDKVSQGRAPTYAEDTRRLDDLLSRGGPTTITVDGRERMVTATAEAEQLLETNPLLYSRVDGAMRDRVGPADRIGARDFAERLDLGLVARAVAWVRLICSSRVDIAGRLIATYPDVDLFTPLLVDLDEGLEDDAPTTRAQQVELGEKLSRASMLGRLAGGARPRLHPFVSFDPLRELRHRRDGGSGDSPLTVTQNAVLSMGFIGVKVYPPMGWRPSGNVPRLGLSEKDARDLDDIVEEFARWCERDHVPVTTHANNSVAPVPGFGSYASPEGWLPIIAKCPGLRLNLGHFGGAAPEPGGWPWQIARAMSPENSIYADVGMHSPENPTVADRYVGMLDRMFAAPNGQTIKRRVMFGTDWFMLAIKPRHEDYLRTYDKLIAQFGKDVSEAFFGGSARSFLGFDDAANKNTQRLVERYEMYAPDRMPDWLARP